MPLGVLTSSRRICVTCRDEAPANQTASMLFWGRRTLLLSSTLLDEYPEDFEELEDRLERLEDDELEEWEWGIVHERKGNRIE